MPHTTSIQLAIEEAEKNIFEHHRQWDQAKAEYSPLHVQQLISQVVVDSNREQAKIVVPVLEKQLNLIAQLRQTIAFQAAQLEIFNTMKLIYLQTPDSANGSGPFCAEIDTTGALLRELKERIG